MYRIYKTLEKYNEYTENGQKLTSGDLYIVTDDKKVILQTNDIDGEFAVYDMIEPTGNIEITENGEDIDVAQYATATVNVEGGNPLFSQFIDGSLTTIEIPEGTTSIGNYAFYYYTELTSITIPDTVTSINDWAFYNCSHLTSVTIPDGVTSIGARTFSGCTVLTGITIPDAVTSIGTSAFLDCTGLTSVTVEATTPPTLSSSAFDSTNNCPIYVPAESVDTYKAATNWSTYADRIQAITE